MNFEGKTFLDKFMIILRGIGIIILYMVASPLLSILFSKSFLNKGYVGKNIALILVETIIMFTLILIFHKRFFNDFKDFKKNYKKYLKTVIPYWVVSFIIMWFSNIIINMIISDGALAANESANRELLGQFPIYAIIAMTILAPISEELLFRASFKNAFSNIVFYSLFTGLLFAGMHVATGIESWSITSLLKNWQELLYFIPYGSMGIAFSYAFYKTDNIFSSISLHVMHNSLTLLFLLIALISRTVGA